MNPSKEMVKLAVKALEDKKGEDIKIIDIQNVSVLADYFIIAEEQIQIRYRQWPTMWRKSSLRLALKHAR